ncbi:MAG: serine/threonine protein kinase [Planctomycetes bacterium]|nr:serine/threonine protein kinase [Planctomycetota bacterium]
MKICLTCEGIAAGELGSCVTCGARLLDTEEVLFPVRRGEEDASHPLLGTTLAGKYRISGVLGRGGMGTVFRAVHEISLQPVAVKVLHPRFARQAEHRRWFLAEARKAGQVGHEHTARILDVGEVEGGTVYLAMELVQGATLYDWLHGSEPLAPAVLVDILLQVAQALSAAHEAGLVHRDLTPRNVMLIDRGGRPFVKVLDFGIAKGVPLGQSASAKDPDSAPRGFANPPYSAPEHLEGRDVDGRADLYSLGVIAYEGLMQRPPVAGATQRELAAATLAGVRRPLPFPSGTPRRLQRLVLGLLERDPQRRPASAASVAHELQRILQPRAAWAKALAAVLLVATPLAAALAWSQRVPAFLVPRPGNPLRLERSAAALPEPAQEVQRRALAVLEFEHGGFAPEQLRVGLSQAGRTGGVWTVAARRGAQGGRLVVDADTRGWATVLMELARASAGGAVDVEFRTPDAGPLGFARVRIDDAAPRTALAVEDLPPGGTLCGHTALRIAVEDDGTLADAVLLVEPTAEGGGEPRVLELGREPVQRRASAAELFGGAFPDQARHDGFVLRVRARDLAGNESVSAPLAFAAVDLRAPRILGLRRRVVQESAQGARLLLELSEFEPDLQVLVRRPGGAAEEILRGGEQAGTRGLLVVLPPVDHGAPRFARGRYEFRVRDAAGNVSEAFVENDLEFAPADAGVVWTVAQESAGHAVVTPAAIVTDGAELVLEFRSSRPGQPTHIRLMPRGRDALGRVPLPIRVREVQGGRTLVPLPELEAGSYEMQVELGESEPGEVETVTRLLEVLPQRLLLRVPDAGAARFRNEVEQAGLLEWRAGEQRLVQGRGWRLEAGQPGLLRGHAWIGDGTRAVAEPLSEVLREDGAILAGFRPREGLNVIALEVRDVLGRPVRILRGERAGEGRVEIARFHHAAEPAVALQSVVRVEFGKPASLSIRVPYPFEDGDPHRDREAITLHLDAAPLRPLRLRREGDATVLGFSLPFDRLALAAGWSDRTALSFLAAGETRVSATLRTPAGVFELGRIVLAPIRSALRAVQLAEVTEPGDPAGLPPALAAIRMVPIPRPAEGRPWPEQTPPAVRDRARPTGQPAWTVRNVEDCYLQAAEFTRAQYDAVLEFVRARGQGLGDRAILVHAADPRGIARLSAGELLPAPWRGNLAGWREAVRLAPEASVGGVDFFQAHAITRVLGWMVAGDPELLRLPTGVELERAALAAGAAEAAGTQRQASRPGAQAPVAASGATLPTAGRSRALGDAAATELGDEVLALDAGLREWALDLPYLADMRDAALLRAWLEDHSQHLERALAFARSRVAFADQPAALVQLGVVRGVGDLEWMAGRRGRGEGVVVVAILRRDGTGLVPGEDDPRLFEVGFRLAGGAEFVTRTRAR